MFQFNVKCLLVVLAVCGVVLSLYVFLVRNPMALSVHSATASEPRSFGDGVKTAYDWSEISTSGSGKLLVIRCRSWSGETSPPPPDDWYQIEGRVVRFKTGATTVPLHSSSVVFVGRDGGVELAEILPQRTYRKLISGLEGSRRNMSPFNVIENFLAAVRDDGN